MKNILILLAFIFASFQVGAQVPNTKGESSSGSNYASNIVAPNYQVTKKNGTTVRLETDNENLFANPSFEHSTPRSSWDGTILGITNSTSSDKTDGIQSYCQTYSGQAIDLHQDSTLYESTYATMRPQGYGSIDTKTAISSTPIYACARLAGSYPADIPNSSLCRVVDTDNIFRTYDIDFVFGGTSNGFGVTSNGVNVTGTICYDKGKLKAEDRRQNVGVVGTKTDFTPTGSWTTNTTYSGEYRQVGDKVDVTTLINLAGAPNAANLTINPPTGFTINSSKAPINTRVGTAYLQDASASAANTEAAIIVDPSDSTKLAIRPIGGTAVTQTFPFTWANSDVIRLEYQVYVNELSGSTTTYSSTNSDTSRLSCGHTTSDFNGFGTVTNIETFCERDGEYLLMSGKFTAGTTTATEARIALKLNGSTIVSAGTSKIPTIQLAGDGTYSAAASLTAYTLREPSVGYITFGLQNASNAGLTKANGSTILGSGNTFSFDAKIPISGWEKSNKVYGSFKGFDYVYVEASSNSTSAIGTPSADIIFEDESIDTRNAYNSSTGIFTVPAGGDGIYSYRAFVLTAPVNLTASQRLFCKALKNGADYSFGTRSNGVGVSQNHSSLVDIEAYLVAGDTLKTQCMTDVSTTLSGVSSGANLTIKRLPGQAP